MQNYTVYIHRNIINNKAYIGVTKKAPNKRWGNNGQNYKKDQPIFYRAIQKYGWDSFEHIIWAESLSEKEAKEWEVRLIALFKTNCCKYKNPEYGYNMTNGGDGVVGHICSDETKEKMRAIAKNRSAKTREKISIASKERLKDKTNHPMYGKHFSDETKQKLREKAKERYSTPEKCPMFGKKHTEEARKKIGDGHRNPSQETREKMRKSAIARCTDEWRAHMAEIGKTHTGKNNYNAKQVYQYSDKWELVQVWDLVKDVALEFKVSESTVSGTWLKNPNRLYRGHHWSLCCYDDLSCQEVS